MTSEKIYQVELRCSYKEWWRYNATLAAEMRDAAGNRTGYTIAEQRIAEVGANLPERPANVKVHSTLSITTSPCAELRLFLFVVPHTLPIDNSIEQSAPFSVTLRFSCDGEVVRTEQLAINQWGGASHEISI